MSVAKYNKLPQNEAEEKCRSICKSFGCEFKCKNVKELVEPDDSAVFYTFNRMYDGYETLLKTEVKSIENVYSFSCDRIKKFIDEYANEVVVLAQDIPCFDVWDMMTDSAHYLFFFHNEESVCALYCEDGYQIGKLYVLEELGAFGEQTARCLREEGFPVNL